MEGTDINIELLQKIKLDNIRTNHRKVSCFSRISASVTQYLKYTVPMFSSSSVCNELLEEGLKEKYPNLWKEIEILIPEKNRNKFDWDWKIEEINDEKIREVYKYMEQDRSRTVLSLYSPRSVIAFEYIRQTTPVTSMSAICAGILEKKLKKKFPKLYFEFA